MSAQRRPQISPWVKWGHLLFRARRIRRNSRLITIEASIRNPDLLRVLREAGESRFGREQRQLVAGDLVRRAVLTELSEESSSSVVTEVHASFEDQGTPEASVILGAAYSEGNKTWTPDDLTELGVRRAIFKEDLPGPEWSPLADPFDQLRTAHVGEESIRPIGRLMLVESLVGSGRAERITMFKLGPRQPGGHRRLQIAWRDPTNQGDKERQVEGDVDL